MRRASLVAAVLLLLLSISARAPRCDFHEPAGHALFASPQVAPLALSADGRRLYVANTTSNTVGVIDTVFSDFFVDPGGDRSTCASGGCHELPLGTGTNAVGGAFDAPGLRGLADRHMQGSLGANSSHDILLFMNDPHGLAFPFQFTPPSEFPYDPAVGKNERSTFAVGFQFFRLTYNVAPVDIFQMLEESSTGTSGATGRQITLDAATLASAERTRCASP
jgi:hypothetical protein